MTELVPDLQRSDEEVVRLFFKLSDGRDVAKLLEVPLDTLNYFVYWGPERRRYREFVIPKRSGKTRLISAPPKNLKILQSKLNHILQLVYRRKPGAHGFVQGRSILTNAKPHVGKRFVLNLDLENFFPTIHFGRVRGVFRGKPYEIGDEAAKVLAALACHNGTLPQGSPSSPMIANMVCAKLDGELQRISKKYGCTYTRYADDITISTNKRDFPVQIADASSGWSGPSLTLSDELLTIVASNKFKVNESKQRLQARSKRQEVTGLVVNRFPNVRRRYLSQIRAMLHSWKSVGLDAAQWRHETQFRGLDDGRHVDFQRVVSGKLEFLRMVKGENDKVFRRLARDLHAVAPELIDFFPDVANPPADDTWERLCAQYSQRIYLLDIQRGDGSSAAGTAFLWRPNVIVTAAHNTLGGELIVCPPYPDQTPIPQGAIRIHQRGTTQVDAALIDTPSSVVDSPWPVRTAPLGAGEQIAVLGYPSVPLHEPGLGIYPGYVESVLTNYMAQNQAIQVTAEISGGMSGAPVIDRNGFLVGIAMETTFAQTSPGVPARAFRHVLPAHYLAEIP